MDIIAQLFTLMMLLLLQAVLGFDNLLYISIESKRAPEEKQAYVRKLGIGVAVITNKSGISFPDAFARSAAR